MKTDLTWVKANKALSTIVAVLGIVVSWSVIEVYIDSKAVSEEEFGQSLEQQARIDAIQNERSDEFELKIISMDLFYARKDRDYLEDQLFNNPDGEAFERRLALKQEEVSNLEGRQCVLKKQNGLVDGCE